MTQAASTSPSDDAATARILLFRMHYTQAKDVILRAYDHSQLLDDEDFVLTQAHHDLTGKKASFQHEGDFLGSRRMLSSNLYLFHIGEWLIKYRVTYPATIDGERAEEKVEDLMRGLEIPRNLGPLPAFCPSPCSTLERRPAFG